MYMISNSDETAEWPKYSKEVDVYLEWKFPMSYESIKEKMCGGRSDFWNILLPAYLKTKAMQKDEL